MMFRKLIQVIFLFLMLTSCANTQKAVYFNGQGDATLPSTVVIPQTVIATNDLLSITVSSLDPKASAVFNSSNVSSDVGGGPVQVTGYLVDADGNIQFPLLGSIKAAGLNEAQLKAVITKSLLDKKYLLDPIVTVRHLNFRVTVLGEVTNPKVITVPNEKITLLEALGLAGDITVYGKRDNVLLIREEGGQKIIKRLNLNTSEILSSPYYYLHSNDVVYVEPGKARVASTSRGLQLLPIVISGLSFLAIIIDRVTR